MGTIPMMIKNFSDDESLVVSFVDREIGQVTMRAVVAPGDEKSFFIAPKTGIQVGPVELDDDHQEIPIETFDNRETQPAPIEPQSMGEPNSAPAGADGGAGAPNPLKSKGR